MSAPTTHNFSASKDGSLGAVIAYEFGVTESDVSSALSDADSSLNDVFSSMQDAILKQYKEADGETPEIGNIKACTRVSVPQAACNAMRVIRNKNVKERLDPVDTTSIKKLVNTSVEGIMKDILGYEKYTEYSHGFLNTNKTKESEPIVRVLVMSRSMGSKQLVNITPFLFNCNINVGSNGGNFNLSLDPVTTMGSELMGWEDRINSNINEYGGILSTEYSSDSVTHAHRTTLKNSKVVVGKDPQDSDGVGRANKTDFISQYVGNHSYRMNMLMSMIISPQDLVFIKFGYLETEIASGFNVDDLLKPLAKIPLLSIENDHFDMIGLVDKVGDSGNIGNAALSVEVKGRDLMKLLIEDGTYFFPIVSDASTDTPYQSNYIANIPQDPSAVLGDRIYQRLFGEIQNITLFTSQPIINLFSFIYKKLNTINVFPISNFTEVSSQSETAVGIWRLTELSVDEGIADRQLVDNSLRTKSGSLLSFFKSACQEPLVEFFGDTYGSRYHFIARKPPYDYADITSLWDSCNNCEIDDNDLYDQNLDMDDSEVYSFYRLIPEAFMFGDQHMTMYYFPAIFIRDYAEIWGSKKLEYTSRYLDCGMDKSSSDNMWTQAIKDLEYIVKTSLLLPFTRKGTVSIKSMRKIKKGTWVYLRGTDEICYVDSVSHSYSISNQKVNAETNLTVSRCMKLRHLNKYFEIMDFPKQSDDSSRQLDWKVNKSVLDWFLQKKQFIT